MNLTQTNTRTAIASIIFISIAASGFLFWLIYFKPSAEGFSQSLTFLPALNASLNSLSAISMCVGFYFIRRRKWQTHRNFMLAALLFSSLFLVSYILHHYLHGDTQFQGAGAIRYVYFAVLISHVVLSIVALPMILITVFLSLSGRFQLHKKIARVTFPVWLYVSITGVLVFILLKVYSPA